MSELLERYETTGEDDAFVQAKRLYEEGLAERAEPELLRDYGYLLECHGHYAIARAAEQYEHTIELDPDKPHYQLISAKAALGNADDATALYMNRVSPTRPKTRASIASSRAPTSRRISTSWPRRSSRQASSSPRRTAR